MDTKTGRRLENKVAIVTGAAKGIGLSISENFCRQGALVVMADIDIQTCIRESEKLNGAGYQTMALQVDVKSIAGIRLLVDKTMEKFKKIDILVNNAAVAISGNILDMNEEDWQLLMDTNLKSVFLATQCVLPCMLEQGSGSIINLSSTQALRSWKNWTAYACAKGGILAMTNQLAGQFGDRNIRFNCISPGAILTPLNQQRALEEGSEFIQKSEQMHAMRRMGSVEEVSMLAVFLASDEASFITGDNILVDGGLSTVPRYDEI
jgi:NAD(P)-dependent dehydrogenase (short-subunit alcohol dehydrogenase family)